MKKQKHIAGFNPFRLKKDELLWLLQHKCKHGHNYLEHPACFVKERPPDCPFTEKIGFLDIEASNIKANFGIILSYCIKEENGKIFSGVLTRHDIMSQNYDKKLIEKCIKDLRRFDRIVVYYGGDNRFDIPELRTRAVMWGLDFPFYKEIKVLDLYSYIKRKFNFHCNRLEIACEFFGIKAKKHPIKYDVWIRAMSGDKKALNYILTHNKEDVISLEKLYHKVVNYINGPNSSI